MAARISNTISIFNKYINRTDNYLQASVVPTNGTRLGLTIQNVKDWDNQAQQWIALYILYSDPLTRTRDINKQVKKFIKDFKKFAQPLLDVIASSPNATVTDGTAFNVVLIRKTPTHVHPVITAICNALYKMLGGCKIKFKCRSITDAKRASLAEGANGVEIAYVIGDKNTKAPDADAIDKRVTYSKATFILSLGTVNSGGVLYIYFRWTNTTHPETAGPWSELQIIPII